MIVCDLCAARPRPRPLVGGGGGGSPDPPGRAPAAALAPRTAQLPRGGPKVTNRRAVLDLAANSHASKRVSGLASRPARGPAPSVAVEEGNKDYPGFVTGDLEIFLKKTRVRGETAFAHVCVKASGTTSPWTTRCTTWVHPRPCASGDPDAHAHAQAILRWSITNPTPET